MFLQVFIHLFYIVCIAQGIVFHYIIGHLQCSLSTKETVHFHILHHQFQYRTHPPLAPADNG